MSAIVWPDQINQAYKGELGAEAGRKARDRINWMCAQAQGETVLDIGCSQGIATLLVAREGFKVVGIDISEDAIAYARAEQQKELPSVAERIEFIWTDLAGLDAGLQFDTVIMGEVLEHQAQTERFLKRAASHVKAGGTLVVTVPFGLHPFPDHKATIFPSDILEILGAEFSVKIMEVQESYIRLTGVKDGSAGADSLEKAVKVTETGALGVPKILRSACQACGGQQEEFGMEEGARRAYQGVGHGHGQPPEARAGADHAAGYRVRIEGRGESGDRGSRCGRTRTR